MLPSPFSAPLVKFTTTPHLHVLHSASYGYNVCMETLLPNIVLWDFLNFSNFLL